MKQGIQQKVMEAVQAVKTHPPMVPSITNTVTINFVANAQLAAGGSAAMVYLPDEGEAVAQAGESMYLNVGTLLPIYAETLPRTARTLHKLGKPWVLDPVAIGIGALRSELLRQMKPFCPSVIRGNASEILALADLWDLDSSQETNGVRGVDSTDSVESAQAAACALANWTGGAVAVSGETDLVTDGKTVIRSYGGSPLMERVTGCGCSLGGVTAVYAAKTDPLTAALTATALYNLAGRRAEENIAGPGSFQVRFLDELYRATPEEIAQNPFDVEIFSK